MLGNPGVEGIDAQVLPLCEQTKVWLGKKQMQETNPLADAAIAGLSLQRLGRGELKAHLPAVATTGIAGHLLDPPNPC